MICKSLSEKSLWLTVAACLLLLPRPAAAQPKREASAQPAEKPESRELTLTTKDGVLVSCVYFPAFIKVEKGKKPDPDVGKGIAPVILVHDWLGRGSELYGLARFLQMRKMSVIVPDLRGHGKSTRRTVGTREEKIDVKKLRGTAIAGAALDIEAAKKFLLQENNKRQVNIEMLTVMGSGFGCALALNWTVLDWSAPRLPTYKQGQDVKALVLLSPKLTYRGASARKALKYPPLRSVISVQVISGTRAPAHKDAEVIYNSLYRPKEDESSGRVVLVELDTNLEGARLLSSPLGRRVGDHITRFVNARIFKLASQLPWQDRTPPFEQN